MSRDAGRDRRGAATLFLVSVAACTSFASKDTSDPIGDGGANVGPDGSTAGDGGDGLVADGIGTGRGTEPRTFASGATSSVNRYTPIVAAAPPGAKTLKLATAPVVSSGDVVIVWQVNKNDVDRSGDVLTLDGDTGRYGFFRVAAVRDPEIDLERALPFGVEAEGAQIITVPEWGDVSVPATATINVPAWNGKTGGVLAFLASGRVAIDGTIDVSAAGFRGAPVDDDETDLDGCTKGDGLPNEGYAPKGEGIARARFASSQSTSATTNGPYAYGNGGGGGGCHNSGGAGGGHAGRGGRGGDQFEFAQGTTLPALGGNRLAYAPLERLAFGGGGGACERNDGTKVGGAPGGGIVIARGRTFAGSGRIRARGAAGTTSSGDGGNGGGAGGVVFLHAVEDVGCFEIDVGGGQGGDATNNGGPGGGGGPGRIVIGGTRASCTLAKGAPGQSGLMQGNPRGAEPGEAIEPVFVLR